MVRGTLSSRGTFNPQLGYYYINVMNLGQMQGYKDPASGPVKDDIAGTNQFFGRAGPYASLRPGGRLVVNMPAYQWLFSAHDRRVHNVRRLTAAATGALLRRAGFQLVEAAAVDGRAAKNSGSWRRGVRCRPVSAMAECHVAWHDGI